MAGATVPVTVEASRMRDRGVKQLFPKWTNLIPTLAALGGFSALVLVVGGMTYYATPKFWEVGYMPEQPSTGFNHRIHAGQLGIDCRYWRSASDG